MAQFTYAQHMAEQANRPATGNGNNSPKMHFMGEFLKNDGDVVVVRFPYHSMNDVVYTTTHNMVMPGAPYGRRIRCTGDSTCPICAQGVKIDTRFFAKCLVYTVDTNTNEVVLNNTVWDRPSAFADIDLKGLFEEYNDISQQLFKIKRNGKGTQTRYTISIVVNQTVYNPAVYKADFTELDQLDALKILSKSITQYNELMNPSTNNNVASKEPTVSVPPVTETNFTTTQPNVNPVVTPATQQNVPTTNAYNNFDNNASAQVNSQASVDETPRRQTRYQF